MGRQALAATAEDSRQDDDLDGPEPGPVGAPEARQASDPTGADGSPALATELTPPAFAQVYEEYFEFVWRSLRMLGVAPEAVEDAAQDAFSVVSRQLPRFEGRSSLRTWLFAILHRVAANHRRRWRRKLQQLEALDESLIDAQPTPHAHAEAAEVLAVIQRFCDGLDDEWRALFVLSLLENIPAPEVAEALDLPLNTVYSRVRRLREGLRRALARRGGARG